MARILPPAVLALLFSLDALVFRTGFYPRLLEPISSSGLMMNSIWNEQGGSSSGAHRVLAVGDSSMRLEPAIATSLGTGYEFRSIAVPATTPRCWYYMLREVDPGANRYDAVILPVDGYDDEDWEEHSRRLSDIQFTAPLLRLGDAVEFSLSYPHWPERWQALEATLLKGVAYRRDFQDLLAHSQLRLKHTRESRATAARQLYDAPWKRQNLVGLEVDWKAWRITYPSGSTIEQQRSLKDGLMHGAAPQIGYLAAYRRAWFGKVLDHYRGSNTRLIFIRLPRGPAVRPANLAAAKSSSIREFGSRPGVLLADEHAFDVLERPHWFGDAIHLNDPGAERFSAMVALETARLLAAGKTRAR